MIITKKSFMYTFISACLITISGCSNEMEENIHSGDSNDSANLTDVISLKGQELVAAALLPKGNRKMPLENYKELKGDTDIMFLHYALSNLPVDYDEVLTEYSDVYRRTNDDFKKQDILTVLKPRVDQEISEAKNSRYVKMKWNGIRLDKYDFEAKGFHQNAVSNDSNLGWKSYGYRITFSNGDAFKLLRVQDETTARLIEQKRSKYERFNLIIYAFAQEAELNKSNVTSQILHLKLLDSRGNELLSM